MTDTSIPDTDALEDENAGDDKTVIIGTGSIESARLQIEKYSELGYGLHTFMLSNSTPERYTWVLTLEDDVVETDDSDDDEESSGCLVVIAAVIAICIAMMGNCWYTDASALRELRVDNPNVIYIEKSTRNVLEDSVLTVRLEDKSIKKYCLNSDILFNYEFSACE